MIKCLLTELGRAGQENIWPSVMAHGPRRARSVSHDLGPNIFQSGPPTQSISTYSLILLGKNSSYDTHHTLLTMQDEVESKQKLLFLLNQKLTFFFLYRRTKSMR